MTATTKTILSFKSCIVIGSLGIGIVTARNCEIGMEGTCTSTFELECGVYMAPSTLGEKTNMGIYTGKDLKDEEVINYPEIAIPLLFRDWNEHRPGFEDGVIWDRYIWEGHVMGLESYEETDRERCKAVFVPGVGCTVNSIMDMANIESTHGSTYDLAGLHRSQDPGTTGFSPYHSAITHATMDIKAGSELFAAYGDYWIPDIPGAQVTLNEPLEKAEDFLRDDYLRWMQSRGSKLSEGIKEAIWELAKDFPVYDRGLSNLPRVSFSEVERFAARGEKDADGNPVSIVKHFIREQSRRTPEWLQSNGYCQDHLRPGISKIDQAGRGAFATRNLPAGSVVGYAPLVHIGVHGRELWTIEYPDGRPAQLDMVINYSFGHRNSTILLTPYGGMVNYINHDSTSPNVRVQWPTRELVAHKPNWLEESAQFICDTRDKIGLSFEYVALRNIEEGEEVVMDYGPEWEAAWKDYVANWVPHQEPYQHSNEFVGQPFRTMSEQETDPYPANIVTMCYESYTMGNGGFYEWIEVLRPFQTRIYCNVLQRFKPKEEGMNHTYTVQFILGEEDKIVVHNVEESGIFIYDRAYSQDWHLPSSFRHEIAIPDDIMPVSWMNEPAFSEQQS